MFRKLLFISLLSVTLISMCHGDSVSLPDDAVPALIPVRVQYVFERLNSLHIPRTLWPNSRDVKLVEGGTLWGQPGTMDYVFRCGNGDVYGIDAMGGNLEIMRPQQPATQQEKEKRAAKSLPLSTLKAKAVLEVKAKYPEPGRLTSIKLEESAENTCSVSPGRPAKLSDPLADEATFKFKESSGQVTGTLNRVILRLRRDTGQLTTYYEGYRKNQIPLTPYYSLNEALALAKWAISKGEPSSVSITLLTDFNDAQQKTITDWNTRAKTALEFEVQEDAWLHQRLVWHFNFNVGEIELDANTGEVLELNAGIPRKPSGWDQQFALPQPIVFPKPPKAPAPTTPLEPANLNFNNADLVDLDALHYPPITRNNAALIFADYFPNFMISTEVHGDDIVLQGLLNGQGKKATLRVDDKKAAIDGHEVELSAAPAVIDGRLYLPAELLQQVNGILIRWEPQKKLLWLETRYLRRD